MNESKREPDALDREIEAFERMRPSLEEHHMGKWVLIRDGKLIGAFDNVDNVAREAIRRFGRGPYLIREVGAGPFRLPASVRYRRVHAAA